MQLCLRSFALGLPFGSMLMLLSLVVLVTIKLDRRGPSLNAEFEKVNRMLDEAVARGRDVTE